MLIGTMSTPHTLTLDLTTTLSAPSWSWLSTEDITAIINTTGAINATTTRAPPPSLIDQLMLFSDYRASLDLGRYGTMVQLVVGTVANMLTLAVMTRRSMITCTTCFYFALLALADLLILYFSCLRRFLFVVNDSRDVYLQARWSCLLMDFATYLTFDLASWILVAMTIDRFVAIRYPLKAAVVCTLRNASVVMAAILLLCVAKNAHFFFTSAFTVNGNCGPVAEHRYFRDKVWPWLDAAFYSFLPFTLLLVFNTLIIHYHRLALRRKHMLTASTSLTVTTHNGFKQRLTIMLLTVSFTFMIMTAPRVILFCIREEVFVFIRPDRSVDVPMVARYSLVSAVTSFLMWTNHTINFFLYCLSGRRFRQELIRMIAHCVHRNRRQQVLASHLPQGRAEGTPRRGSNSSTLSDDVVPQPVQPPTEQEDPMSRVNRWAIVTFNDKCPHNAA